jgi:tripartite-type tricarboxylate transporter receptor subunit TctC
LAKGRLIYVKDIMRASTNPLAAGILQETRFREKLAFGLSTHEVFMPMPHFIVSILLLGMMILGMGAATGQNYPNKPIRIVTTEPAGAADIATRLIAPGLTGSLGQQVIVDNRSGAGSVAAIESVAKGPPDGYTLLLHGSPVWLMPFMRDHVPWDPVRDFSPITLAVTLPNLLVVHPSLPVRSVKELIALAKARPGELNYGSGSTGASNHLAAELFSAMARVSMVRIPYKGGGPAVLGLIGGQVQLMFATAASVSPHVKSGRLRALAVTSAEPSALFPGLPAVAASGLPGYEAGTIYGVFAPANTPALLIERLHQEIARALNRAEVKERLFNSGMEAAGSSPEAFAAVIKSDMAKWGKVIRDAGIRDE